MTDKWLTISDKYFVINDYPLFYLFYKKRCNSYFSGL